MGWRFRKSFSPIPGLRLTFSPRGISTSVGAGPLRFTVGPQGPAVTARIPGTGISFRQPLGTSGSTSKRSVDPHHIPPGIDVTSLTNQPVTEVHSGATETLTSLGLAAVKELLVRAQEERANLLPELREAEVIATRVKSRYQRWTNGWIFRRMFRQAFARLGELAAEAEAKVDELQEQERLSRLATEFDLPDNLKDAFGHLCDATAAVSRSQRIWDTISTRSTDQNRERTTALRTIERKPVSFSLGSCDLVQSEWKVPHLTNANGGEMLIYPGFILYHVSNEAFALVDIRGVSFEFSNISFIEEESIPADTKVIGHTWKKVNKDGSPDRRFANNYQIPLVVYGDIRITSKTGLNEEYQISNAEVAHVFAKAFTAFRNALPPAT